MGTWVGAGIAAALALAALSGLAGCGGGGEEELPTLQLGDAGPGGRFGDASPGPGLVVRDFVHAARRGHAEQMWSLLSAETRAALGPTYERFRRGNARRLHDDLANFRRAEVHLSRRLRGGWGVGAVVGRYEDEGVEPQPAAFAAAVRRQAGGWRLELGGLVFGRLEPNPLEETGTRPELRAEAQTGGEVGRMLMWVDGRPVEALPSRGLPFTAELRGVPAEPLPSGERTVVVFAVGDGTAGALAWPFSVA